jgi:uncharacterized BrkB/YihY/UPF0761 family membrane protein
MYESNLLIGIVLALFSLSGFVLALRQGAHWIRNASVLDKLQRALFAGLGFAICFISGVISLDYLVSPNLEKNWDRVALSSLICMTSPMIILTTIGAFIWNLRRDATQSFLSNRLDRIIQKSRKPK